MGALRSEDLHENVVGAVSEIASRPIFIVPPSTEVERVAAVEAAARHLCTR